MNLQASAEKRRAKAVNMMKAALAILDEVGPPMAASTLALAIERAGSPAAPLRD